MGAQPEASAVAEPAAPEAAVGEDAAPVEVVNADTERSIPRRTASDLHPADVAPATEAAQSQVPQAPTRALVRPAREPVLVRVVAPPGVPLGPMGGVWEVPRRGAKGRPRRDRGWSGEGRRDTQRPRKRGTGPNRRRGGVSVKQTGGRKEEPVKDLRWGGPYSAGPSYRWGTLVHGGWWVGHVEPCATSRQFRTLGPKLKSEVRE